MPGISQWARSRLATAIAAVGVPTLLLAPASANAAIYTYTRLVDSTDQWSTGSGWSGGTVPVSAPTTTLAFGGAGAAGTFAVGTGPTIVSNNDLTGAAVNAQGQFELNQLTASYSSPAGAGNPTALITISGGPLLLLNDGAVTPVLSLRSNSSSSGTATAKPILTLANNLVLGSSSLKIVGESNFTGGPASAIVNITGTLSFTTARAHSIELGGDHSATASNTTLGRNLISTLISDQSAGNATSLTKSGTSFWEMTGANTYTGGTTITGGTLRATMFGGMGSGPIGVSGGGQAWLDVAGTYTNNFSIAGSGPGGLGALRLVKDTFLSSSSTITLTGDARIGNTTTSNADIITIDAKIIGTGNLTFGIGAANTPIFVINNPLNAYVGNTTLFGESSTTASSSSTSAFTLRIGANNAISAGDLTLQMGTRNPLTLQLRGFNETFGGLFSAGQGLITRAITNGNTTGTSASILTIGTNNADGTYRGTITGSSTNTIALTKIGTGHQILSGTTSYFGNTTVSGGKLTLDYNLYATSQTNSESNHFSQNSTLVLNGGTFAIDGRGAGSDATKTGTTSNRLFTLAAGQDTIGLVAGQPVTAVTIVPGPIYIAGIDRIANTVYLSEVPNPLPTSITAVAMSAGVTSQTIKGLTVDAASGINSTIDFGTNGSVLLTFNAFAQTNNGSTLTIANWSGSPSGGGADQLIFAGTPSAFTSLFAQSEITFAGYGPGYAIIPGTGNFEVVAVPEPGSIAVLGLGGLLLLGRRRPGRRTRLRNATRRS